MLIAEANWTADLEKIDAFVFEKTGRHCKFVLGGIEFVGEDGRVRKAMGVHTGDSIIVRADHPKYTVEQLALHEMFHALDEQDPGLRKRIEEQLRAQAGGSTWLDDAIGKYIENLRGIYTWVENDDVYGANRDIILEREADDAMAELLANIYAGMDVWEVLAAPARQTVVSEAKQVYGKHTETAAATDRTTGPPDAYAVDERFAVDIYDVPQEIHDFVDNAVADRESNETFVVATAAKAENSAINRLGGPWQGKYTEAPRVFSGEYVRHVIREHGNALIEMLRGQMYMSRDSIKIALSQLQEGKGRIVRGTFTERGMPSVLTEIPVNGYTLYAEEPLNLKTGTELEGRTMYMTPTSTTALSPYNKGSIPQRRDGASYSSISGKDRIVNGLLAGDDGMPTKLFFVEKEGIPYTARETYGAVLLCTDEKAAKSASRESLATKEGYVAVTNPCIVSAQNPIINKKDFRGGEVAQRIAEIKTMRFDAIIMDYKDGDNYAVLVFDKNNVIPESEYTERPATHDSYAVDTEEDAAETAAGDLNADLKLRSTLLDGLEMPGEAAALQQEIKRLQERAGVPWRTPAHFCLAETGHVTRTDPVLI